MAGFALAERVYFSADLQAFLVDVILAVLLAIQVQQLKVLLLVLTHDLPG